MTGEELAKATGSDASSLARLLRVLAPAGITEVEPGRFALTAPGGAVTSTPAESPAAGLQLLSFMLRPLSETARAVRSGRPAFEQMFGLPIYQYVEEHPEFEEMFGRAMQMLRDVTVPITEAYDFSGVGTLVDVGGGHGWRTIEVLQAHPRVRGVLFDRPGATESARAALSDAGFADRCEVVGGSFFDEVPSGGDCYLISAVLPNWNDHDALRILSTTRKAMPEGAQLLLFEPVMPESNAPHLARTLDLLMLVVLGGQVRSEAQLDGLLQAAGFRPQPVVETNSPFSLVPAVPV